MKSPRPSTFIVWFKSPSLVALVYFVAAKPDLPLVFDRAEANRLSDGSVAVVALFFALLQTLKSFADTGVTALVNPFIALVGYFPIQRFYIGRVAFSAIAP